MSEKQNIEYKSTWKNEYLCWIFVRLARLNFRMTSEISEEFPNLGRKNKGKGEKCTATKQGRF